MRFRYTLCFLWVLVSCGQPDLPRYAKLPAFSLKDQYNHSFGSKNLANRVWIAGFFFTSCPSVCPLLTAHMAHLQKALKRRRLDIQLVSISVDPETDTPQRLKLYGKNFGADFSRWHFLTGDSKQVQALVSKGFKLAVGQKQINAQGKEDILHSTRFVLIDAQRVIRGYYRSDAEGRKKVLSDANRLISQL